MGNSQLILHTLVTDVVRHGRATLGTAWQQSKSSLAPPVNTGNTASDVNKWVQNSFRDTLTPPFAYPNTSADLQLIRGQPTNPAQGFPTLTQRDR
jgi:hypothetical protein